MPLMAGLVYIVSAIIWLWIAENVKPDRWDVIGGSVSLIGAAIILWGTKSELTSCFRPIGAALPNPADR